MLLSYLLLGYLLISSCFIKSYHPLQFLYFHRLDIVIAFGHFLSVLVFFVFSNLNLCSLPFTSFSNIFRAYHSPYYVSFDLLIISTDYWHLNSFYHYLKVPINFNYYYEHFKNHCWDSPYFMALFFTKLTKRSLKVYYYFQQSDCFFWLQAANPDTLHFESFARKFHEIHPFHWN